MNKESYCFFTKDGKYIALDLESGGYPYKTDNPMKTYIFTDLKQAERYVVMFKGSGATPSEDWILKKFLGILVDDV